MAHKKGHTNNPKGRPTGTPNKSTQELRSFILAFIEKNTENLQDEFDKLEGSEKFRVIEKFIQYILPKYSSVGFVDYKKDKDEPLVIVMTSETE